MSDNYNEAAAQKGHPKGLYVLFATEMWERFSYYGMRAVLVLFLINALQYEEAFAFNIYGSYTSLVYLTPLVGGYIADRFWGNRRSILMGGLLMAMGQFMLFFCASMFQSNVDLSQILFYAGLAFLIVGNGFFKPNISSMVGQLYPVGDKRLDAAYTIFYMGINAGGFLGPLVCGYVGERTGQPEYFKYAFLAAGIGMLLSVVIFENFKNKYIRNAEGQPIGVQPPATGGKNSILRNSFNPLVLVGIVGFAALVLGTLYIDINKFGILIWLLPIAVIIIAFMIFTDKNLTKTETQQILVIFILAFFVIFFWSAFEQAGASLTYFTDKQTDRSLGSWEVPASWFQSLNSAFVILFAPVMAFIWLRLGSANREPASPLKMAIGLFLLSLGYLVIAIGVKGIGATEKASMIWLIAMYFLHTLGELCLSPIGLSLVNKLAPFRFASLLMAVWFLANAAANKLAGVLSALIPANGPTSFIGYQIEDNYDFFMLFVVMSGVAAVILFLLSSKLLKMMRGVR
jgi:proton-dependent oligopeptide transporter, POT family